MAATTKKASAARDGTCLLVVLTEKRMLSSHGTLITA
jgi:hypothetical protein